MDSQTRTRKLLDEGDTVEEIVRKLRDEGFSLIHSMSALMRAAGVSFADAKTAVVESAVWADQRDRVVTNRWIDPPEPPDASAIERLNEACSEPPRVTEAWVTGSQMTPHDGSSQITTTIAVVLDPPLTSSLDPDEDAATNEIITRLNAAWRPKGRRQSWAWVGREKIAREQAHCIAIYSRP